MGEAYHWTPQQIGRLTIPQVMMYMENSKTGRPGVVKMSPSQAAAFVARKKGLKES